MKNHNWKKNMFVLQRFQCWCFDHQLMSVLNFLFNVSVLLANLTMRTIINVVVCNGLVLWSVSWLPSWWFKQASILPFLLETFLEKYTWVLCSSTRKRIFFAGYYVNLLMLVLCRLSHVTVVVELLISILEIPSINYPYFVTTFLKR